MLDTLTQSDKVQAFKQAIEQGDSVLIEEMWNAPKACLSALAQQASHKHLLILTGASIEEARLFHDFTFFTKSCIIDYPSWETLPSEGVAPSSDIVGERYQSLEQILLNKEPKIVITSLQAALQKVICKEHFQELYLSIKRGQTLSFEDLPERLNKMGYTKNSTAADKGEYAVRGGIIDIFPVSSPDPVRIEFWGDTVESLRLYDPIGQKSVKKIKTIAITPAQELQLLKTSEKMDSLLDYLGPNTLVIFDDLLSLEDRYATLTSMGDKSPFFFSIEEFLDQIAPFQTMFWSSQPIEELSEVVSKDRNRGYYSDTEAFHSLQFELFHRTFKANRWRSPFVPIGQYFFPDQQEVAGSEILDALGRLVKNDYTLHLLFDTELEKKNFDEKNISLPEKTHFHQAYLSGGFALHDIKIILLPNTEMTHHYKIRRQKLRSTFHTPPTEVFNLAEGDLVVHLNNGIGHYLGVEKRPNHEGIPSEFMVLEYANTAKLFVPVQQSHLVTKYIGARDETPAVHTLGSKKWARTKATTEKAIVGYAQDLLVLYAKRTTHTGFSYPEDSSDVFAFEEAFPYVETEDQLLSIQQIKTDMMAQKPMDRLVCGDVGYGKTEVAMRAAFKAVFDGAKQVAVLVPTTILAMQHFDTFVERMRYFSVNVGVLSRFRTAKEIRETLKGVEDGSVDILIGTHRIISKDVKFKDLGLVIVDEEHRFGVRAKEHLKKFRHGVDYLTLSATPIPRTLYMSLVEVRDMSTINTPPQDRQPIKTIIAEPNQELLKGAILRELGRDGQIFYIHNRVETIFDAAAKLQKLVPKARILIGHGQMSPHELDIVYHTFKKGDADILVSTTIVENGVDIPNANTIIIDRADRFGLADLYQLRGRVGRWNRKAYAYFLIPSERTLNVVARKRLSAILESSGYGGGMKLAMRDLEIRGAGNLLGTDQSGQVSSIGFHLYCKLLKKAVKRLQGSLSPLQCETKIDTPFDARLPEEYVNATELRMEIYQRLAEALNFEEIEDIFTELKDRFGKLPKPALWLYHLTRIRVVASEKGIETLKFTKKLMTTPKGSAPLGFYQTPAELEATALKLLSFYS